MIQNGFQCLLTIHTLYGLSLIHIFASACNLLGLEVQDLDEGKSQIAHGETVRETANMISFMADVKMCIRDSPS